MPIALPDQVLPDGSTCLDACNPTINDSGVVGFVVQRQGDPLGAFSAYQWREEVITPVAVVGQQLPDGERIGSVFGVWVNNHDSNIMLAIQHAGATDGSYFLYRYVEGQIVPLVGPGHTMPGGGNLRRLQDFGVSFPNDLGQHAFLARLDDGTTAAYLLDADGTLTRLLASGLTTDDGTITNVGEGAGLSSGLALNGLGQIAVTVRFGTGLDTVVLVSPP